MGDFIQDLLVETKSNLPAHTYKAKSFGNWRWQGSPRDKYLVPEEQLELWDAIGKFWGMRLPLLMLYGKVGVGKTHLALAIGWTMLVGRNIQVMYFQAEALLDQLRASYDSGDYSALMESVKKCGLLIIDDLGAHKETEYSLAKLDAIVDYRYMECKHTIITSNALEIPPRILDRCKEGFVVRVRGVSQRKAKG